MSQALSIIAGAASAAAVADRPGAPAKPAGPVTWCDRDAWDEAELPARPWLAKGYLLAGAITTIVGPGGVSKSSLILAYAIALALGIDLGGFRPIGRTKTVVYNVEDDATEQRRRLTAMAAHMGSSPAEIGPMIARTGPARIGVLFQRGETGMLTPTDAMLELRQLVIDHYARVLFVDPLAELHDVEENENTGMRAVLAEFRALAVELNIAVVILHHTRKGVLIAGDAEAARGASAILGASRIVLTLVHMAEAEAQTFGLPTGSHRHFFRVDGGKSNYAALTNCEWFERVQHLLPTSGEFVAVPVPWAEPIDAITAPVIAAVIAKIEAGICGEPYSPKIENRPRSIKHAMVAAGVQTKDGQVKLLDRLLGAGDVEKAQFKDGNYKPAAGLRTPVGKPDAPWIDADDK